MWANFLHSSSTRAAICCVLYLFPEEPVLATHDRCGDEVDGGQQHPTAHRHPHPYRQQCVHHVDEEHSAPDSLGCRPWHRYHQGGYTDYRKHSYHHAAHNEHVELCQWAALCNNLQDNDDDDHQTMNNAADEAHATANIVEHNEYHTDHDNQTQENQQTVLVQLEKISLEQPLQVEVFELLGLEYLCYSSDIEAVVVVRGDFNAFCSLSLTGMVSALMATVSFHCPLPGWGLFLPVGDLC